MTNSKKRAAAVTGAPVMTSPTEPTNESPASRTTRPAAMATVGSKLQSELGTQPVEHQRRRGRDRAADRVLEEERQSVPVQLPIDPVDRHGAQRADQAGQQPGAEGSRRREGQRTPGEGGDPALVRVRRGDDGVELVAGRRRRHLTRADATDQTVDGGQSAEVHRPGLHDVQRAGGRRRGPTVGRDVDRRVDDVDLAALDAVGAGDGRDLVHRGGGRHPGRHQNGADRPGQVEHLAHARAVGGVELCAAVLVIRGRLPVGGSVSRTMRFRISR